MEKFTKFCIFLANIKFQNSSRINLINSKMQCQANKFTLLKNRKYSWRITLFVEPIFLKSKKECPLRKIFRKKNGYKDFLPNDCIIL